jgi:hypothetical protein
MARSRVLGARLLWLARPPSVVSVVAARSSDLVYSILATRSRYMALSGAFGSLQCHGALSEYGSLRPGCPRHAWLTPMLWCSPVVWFAPRRMVMSVASARSQTLALSDRLTRSSYLAPSHAATRSRGLVPPAPPAHSSPQVYSTGMVRFSMMVPSPWLAHSRVLGPSFGMVRSILSVPSCHSARSR